MIPAWLMGIGRWIAGDLTGALTRAYAAKKAAETDEARLAADERIKKLQARQEVILAAQGDPIERFVRVGFALPFVIYTWKLVIFDKVLGWGSTDGLSDDLWAVMMIVIGGYFVDTVVRRVVRR